MWKIDEINQFSQDAFVARLGFLFEGSPWIAATVWEERPFASRDALERALARVVAQASRERQLGLIRAHPDLVGRAAMAGTLGRSSTSEQTAAGLDPNQLSADDMRAFTEYNAAYAERFGFPFVICARENKKASILAGFEHRLQNDRDTEIATALREIGKICHYRLLDVVAE
jgi:OHCU decarboxylase